MWRILITGANGQLGRELKDVFSNGESQYDCIFLNREQLTLDQIEGIQDTLSSYWPDIIIHAAAYTAVDLAEAEPALADRINHLASAEIAKYCSINDVKLLFISTDYVFNGKSAEPLLEDATVDPVNIYGLTKLKAERAIQNHYPEAIIIRTSWIYSVYGKNFVKTMLRLMRERDEISVINDQIGSPTYAKDLAKALLKILNHNSWLGGIYHYSNEGRVSWYEFAIAIRDLAGLTCEIKPIPTSAYPTPAKRPHFSLLDKEKIKRQFDLHVPEWKNSLVQMLNKMLTYKEKL